MAGIVIVGAQWGDEGKGKVVDLLAEKADMVISFLPGPDWAQKKDSSRLNVRIVLRHPIPLPDLEAVVRDAEKLEPQLASGHLSSIVIE